MADFKIINLSVNKIAEGKINAGKLYCTITLRDTRNFMAKPFATAIFEEDAPELFTAVRNALPATGNNPATNQPWNGTNTTLPATHKMEDSIKALSDAGFGVIMGGHLVDAELGGKYVMEYATPLNGHAVGDPVLESNSNYAKTVEKVKVFVIYADEVTKEPLSGWDVETRIRSRKRNLTPVETYLSDPQKKSLINPRDYPDYMRPSVPAEAGATAETPVF